MAISSVVANPEVLRESSSNFQRPEKPESLLFDYRQNYFSDENRGAGHIPN